MTTWGTETETTFLDGQGSMVDVITKIERGNVQQRWKRITLRIKVADKREETTQFLMFSDLIAEKRRAGVLIVRDNDPATLPAFMLEYPKRDVDGSYFIVRSFTELVV